MNLDLTGGTARRVIATTEQYADAEAIVDLLTDTGFPVEHVSIVGGDLTYVEQVVGRLDVWRATAGGCGSGALLGLLSGLVFAVWFAHDGTSLMAILLYWTVIGAFFGALLSALTYVARRGQHRFASVAGVQAERFDVIVDEPYAADALRRLSGVDAGHDGAA